MHIYIYIYIYVVASVIALGFAIGCQLRVDQHCCLVSPGAFCNLGFIFASPRTNTSNAWICCIVVDGGVGLFTSRGCFTGVGRASVIVIVVIVGGCFGAMNVSKVSSEQHLFPQVVAARVSRSQLVVCMFGKFGARSFTRSTRNLHLAMLLLRVGPLQFHPFHCFDVYQQGPWVWVILSLPATG